MSGNLISRPRSQMEGIIGQVHGIQDLHEQNIAREVAEPAWHQVAGRRRRNHRRDGIEQEANDGQATS